MLKYSREVADRRSNYYQKMKSFKTQKYLKVNLKSQKQ